MDGARTEDFAWPRLALFAFVLYERVVASAAELSVLAEFFAPSATWEVSE